MLLKMCGTPELTLVFTLGSFPPISVCRTLSLYHFITLSLHQPLLVPMEKPQSLPQILGMQRIPVAGIRRPHSVRDAWDVLQPCPGNQGTPGKPTNTRITAPLLLNSPSQPLALEGIQERWWQTGTQTNSQAGLFLVPLIVPLMKADKVTSPLCAARVVFALFFYLFLSL